MSKLFSGVRQVGYVVRDIEQAMLQWSRLGVGPWFCREQLVPVEFRYRGQMSPPPALSIALANSGDLQLELIQQFNEAPSLYLDSLHNSGECAQHVAYWTPDAYDAYCSALLERGFIEGHAGRMGAGRGRFAYFVNPQLPSAMIEISESSGGKAEFFEQVRRAAISWDGSEPVRRLPPV